VGLLNIVMNILRVFSLLLGSSGVCLGGIAPVEDLKAQYLQEQQVTNLENNVETNEATNQYDSYSMYRKLMDLREEMLEKERKEESEGLKMVKTALKVVLETAFHSFVNGFLPTVERVRRDADEEKKGYLNGAVYVVGALLGKKKCSQMIACRTGKFIQSRMPGSQLAVMMAESMVPKPMLDWFGVLKTAVIDRSDSCEADFECTLSFEKDGPPEEE